MADPVDVILKHPIKRGSDVVTKITVRPVKGRDWRGLETKAGREMDATLRMASRLTGQPDDVIDELEGEDLNAVLDAVGAFLGAGRPTGGTQ